jgi:hypothetical protein
MKENKLKIALCIGLLSFTTLANAGDNLKCSDAMKIGAKAYDRTALAYNAGSKNTAIIYSKAFWDIYDSNRDCEYLGALASKLEQIGITNSSRNTTKPPSAGGGCVTSKFGRGSVSHFNFITYMEECDYP